MIGNCIYQAFARLRHQLCAWNTGGEGIHSPYLFHLVRMVIYDTNSYYCFQPIEQRREAMLRAPKKIAFDDFGTGKSGSRLVCDIAKNELESPKIGQMIFRLIVHLSQESSRPLHVLELGTSLGLTSSYMQLANTHNQVVTMEGCSEVAEMARLNWRKLGIEEIKCIEGNIDDTLEHTLNKYACAWDLVFIDANHTAEATLRYFTMIQRWVHAKTIVIVDDIHHSADMERGWKQLLSNDKVTTSMDCFHCGLLFFDSNYLRKNYRLRL